MSLDKIRAEIDRLDEQIVDLLNQRTARAIEIGRIKEITSSSVYVPAREKDVLERVSRANNGPLSERNLRAIYREIMSASISQENKVVVAYLGPPSTYSHQAARARFGDSVDYLPVDTLHEVFAAVEKGKASYGVVPVENSIEGGISATQDALTQTPLRICAEMYQPIQHHLLGLSGITRFTKIYSHPQSLGQCRAWLERHHAGVDLIPVSSNGRAAEMAAAEPGAGAIAGSLAAELFKLETYASNIQDISGNTTRFFVIGEACGKPTGSDKTSLYFGVQHKVGALVHAMQPFERRRLNLMKIESRPIKTRAWEYFFFVDLEGHADDAEVKAAIDEVRQHCSVLQVLGSYPRATTTV